MGYRSIVKGSAVFGGVQVFNILIGLIRGKAVALFLGPFGVGVSSLLVLTTNIIVQFSSFGVNMSAVKEIAKAREELDDEKANLVTFNFRILLLFLATLGGAVCFFFAPALSLYTFDSKEQTLLFRLLSLFVVFTILSSGELAIMQANRQLRKVAVSSVIGSFLGLIIGVPFYYYLKNDGIVPAMIALAVCTYGSYLIVNLRDSKGLTLKLKSFNQFFFVKTAREMMTLGFVLMISGFIGTVAIYLVNIFINKYGGVADVGYFQSASSITTQYTAIIFSAMAVDYFPKLAAKADSVEHIQSVVTEQLEIVVLILAPVIVLFIVFCPLIVKILLTSEFLNIVPIIKCMAVGVFFKALSYPLGYISFAKGDKKIFFWLEGVFSNILQLTLNVLFYHFFGLIGLGFSFIAIFAAYFFVINAVVSHRYNYRIDLSVIRLVVTLILPISVAFLSSELIDNIVLEYFVNFLSVTFILFFAFKQLDLRLDIVSLLKSKFSR